MFTKLIFSIDKNQSAFGSHLRTPVEKFHRIFFQQSIFLGSSQAFCQNFFFGDIGVMLSDFGFGRRRNYRLGKFLVLLHSLGQLHPANFAYTAFISTPSTSAQVSPDNHFHRKTFTHHSYGYHRVGSSHLPVGADIGRRIEEFSSNLIQHLTLERNPFRKNHVKCRYTVGSDHDKQLVIDIIHITHLSVINTLLSGKVKIGFYQSFFHFYKYLSSRSVQHIIVRKTSILHSPSTNAAACISHHKHHTPRQYVARAYGVQYLSWKTAP